MNSQFDLDRPLLTFYSNDGASHFTIRDSVQGTQLFGSLGSGKTSSGRKVAEKFLLAGYGGLVLTVKSDEKKLWESYCRETNRLDDLIIVEPGGEHNFNFLDYEAAKKLNGLSLTENLVQVLKAVIQSSEEKSSGKSDDPFWESALDMLIYNVIDLVQLAYTTLTIKDMYEVVMTAPKKNEIAKGKAEKGTFRYAFEKAMEKVQKKVDAFKETLPAYEKEKIENDAHYYDELLKKNIPEADLLASIDQFFVETYRNLSDKTRSIIEFSFSGFLFRLSKEPVHSLFCSGKSTFTPESCNSGKIILINLPVKVYQKVGRDCQVLFKYIWQRALGIREATNSDRPIFLWADEAQNFLHSFDSEYQATARSSKIATVYISQNLANYHANMGGTKSEYRVKSFLGTLGTKIFFANADLETNNYASDLIGQAYTQDNSSTSTVSGTFSSSRSKSYKLEKMVRPEEFVGLKTGGPLNDFRVEAYIHRQGTPFHDGLNFRKVTFKQQ